MATDMTNWKQGGPTSSVFWGQRLMCWCVALPAKVVNDAAHGVDMGTSNKSKLLLSNNDTIEELLRDV